MFFFFFFFFNDTATTEIYTLSLHDALPISPHGRATRRVSARPSLRRDVRRRRAAAPTHAGAVRGPADAHRRRPGAAGGGPRPQLPRPGRHVLSRRRGVDLSARPIPRLIPAAVWELV